ncbi:RAP protein, putative [Plasmodium gaboni]|uniref:RAP protein, putative n=1 Tax=Plasmodium gaboni TaxID=647221 RepID=A0ABY1UUV5_9APIC|nr:RAP protein, putative [Plasmodium gaboni]
MLLKRGRTFFYSQIKSRRFFCDGKNNYINNSYSNYIHVNKNIKNNNNYEDDNELNKKNKKSGDIPKNDGKLKTSQHSNYNSNNYRSNNYVHSYDNKHNHNDTFYVNHNMNQMENNMTQTKINDELFYEQDYNKDNKNGNDDSHTLDYLKGGNNNYNNNNNNSSSNNNVNIDNIHSIYNDSTSNNKMEDLNERKENMQPIKNVDEKCNKNDNCDYNYMNYNHNKEYNIHSNMSSYNHQNRRTKEEYIKDKNIYNNHSDNKNKDNHSQEYSYDDNINNDMHLNDKDNFINNKSHEHIYEHVEKNIKEKENVKEINDDIVMNEELNKKNSEKNNMENDINDNNKINQDDKNRCSDKINQDDKNRCSDKINQDDKNKCSDKNLSSEWIENEEDIPNVFEVDENLTEEEKQEKLKLIKLITEKLASPLKTASDNKNQNERTENEHENKNEENSLFADDRPIAIEVDGPSHFYANSNRYTTYTKLKHRILTKLGYNVIHISYIDWRKLRNKSEREEFILKKLKEKNDEFLDDEDRTYYNERMNMIKDDYVKYMNDKKANTN